MISEQLKELEKAQERVAKIQQRIAAERKQALLSLPAQYGFDSMEELITELRTLSGGRGKYVRLTDGIGRKSARCCKRARPARKSRRSPAFPVPPSRTSKNNWAW